MYPGVVSGGPVLIKYACTRHCIVLKIVYGSTVRTAEHDKDAGKC